MNLAVNPPVLPMLAKKVGELPPGEGWIFEPNGMASARLSSATATRFSSRAATRSRSIAISRS